MNVQNDSVPERRDLRLDLFRGLANWAIFLDHVPNNVLSWITVRNYGFSDAADIFVFISGFSAAAAYSAVMRAQGWVAGAARLFARVRQLYIAHVLLFVVYVAAIGWVAQTYSHSHLLDEFNVATLISAPIATLTAGLLLTFKPLNLDVLPLYVVLMASFAPVLWLLLRYPLFTLLASAAVYFLARFWLWNLPAYPVGVWYFNPLTWQFLFVLGAWCFLSGKEAIDAAMRSRVVLAVAVAYLAFALLMSVAARFDSVEELFPPWLIATFSPNDKTNLAPYRVLHLLALALLVIRMIPRDASYLTWPVLQPAILCGQRSLDVFCAGVFLAFIAHFLLEIVSNAIAFQVVVSVLGIATMVALARYKTWEKKLAKSTAASPRLSPTGPKRTARAGAMAGILIAALMIDAGYELRAETPKATIVGLGATTCRRFKEDIKSDPSIKKVYLAWTQGFMSGILSRRPPGVDEGLDLNPATFGLLNQLRFLEDLCAKNSSWDFSDAVAALYKRLREEGKT
ncbi:MAG: OpgC domain-containing protein [Pseudomonadota bacterium]|jgi:hypothetical protein